MIHNQAGVNPTLTPARTAIVRVCSSKIGVNSLGSIFLNSCKILIVVYEASVKANCWPILFISSQSEVRGSRLKDLPYSWTAIEGKVLPRRPQCFPPFRSEFRCVGTVDILSAMHDVDLIVDLLTFLHEYG
jgi:hypothetical protein